MLIMALTLRLSLMKLLHRHPGFYTRLLGTKPQHNRKKSRGEKNREFLGIKGLQQGFQIGEEIEEFKDSVDAERPHYREHAKRAEENQRQLVLKKIIERKHFKGPQEVNLLTWDAKEQMRFLYAEYPDTWTVEQLAKSFPISEEGVKFILKSKWQPHTLKEVLKHDQRVQKHWLALKAGGDLLESDGPLYSRYQNLVDEGRLHLLAHAGGISSLPSPKHQPLLLADDKPPIPTDGPFASIVKAYCEKRERKQQVEENGTALMQELHDSNVRLIEGMVESSLIRSGRSVQSDAVQSELKATYKELDMEEKDTNDYASLIDVDLQPPKRNEEKWISNSNTKLTSEEIDTLATLDTGKIEKETDVKLNEDLHQKNNSKFRTDVEKKAFVQSIRYEEQENGAEAYVYSERDGYHFPYGQKANIEQQIDIKKCSTKVKTGLHRKGKMFYDEDGEFLYKLP